MSKITDFFPGGGGSSDTSITRTQRKIFTGPASLVVPSTTTQVEVHVWGGGGQGYLGGGGGGGYATGVYETTGGETFTITVGGLGESSSVTCPSLSPNRPLSATGGSAGSGEGAGATGNGGAGGTGSADPNLLLTFTASGGTGGPGFPGYRTPQSRPGAGGAAGSLLGDGGAGGASGSNTYGSGGGGIGGVRGLGQLGGSPAIRYGIDNPKWLYIEEIGGYSNDIDGTDLLYSGAGAGASGLPSGSLAKNAGFLGGGHGGAPTGGSAGGLAGGMGGAGPNNVSDGSGGCVIIYY